jgi:hypothetical protein
LELCELGVWHAGLVKDGLLVGRRSGAQPDETSIVVSKKNMKTEKKREERRAPHHFMAGSLPPRATRTRRLWAWVTENSHSTSISRVSSAPPVEAVPSSRPTSSAKRHTLHKEEGYQKPWRSTMASRNEHAASTCKELSTGDHWVTAPGNRKSVHQRWPALYTTHHTLVP